MLGLGLGLVQRGFSRGGVGPVNTVAPVISGTPTVGQTLSTTNGTWTGSPSGYTYQWNRDGVAISGATASTYVLVGGDATKTVTCTVTATNAGGSTAATSNSLGPVSAADPYQGAAYVWDFTGVKNSGVPYYRRAGVTVAGPTGGGWILAGAANVDASGLQTPNSNSVLQGTLNLGNYAVYADFDQPSTGALRVLWDHDATITPGTVSQLNRASGGTYNINGFGLGSSATRIGYTRRNDSTTRSSVNGAAVVDSGSRAAPFDGNFSIGNSEPTGNPLGASMRLIQVWTTSLTDAELVAAGTY